jgi:8-oxo-dGTP pyrophosphatase MutT (NUDIX family)
MRVYAEEVTTLQDLEGAFRGRDDIPRPYSVAVEGLVFDRDFRWILMKRGKGCRDEIGKLEGIGGSIEKDADFPSALKREIREEVGTQADIRIVSFFEVRKDTVDVPGSAGHMKKHWIIVSFICFLHSGQLQIVEPEKNEGFVFKQMDAIDREELSSSAKAAFNSLLPEWDRIRRSIAEVSKSI